VPSSDRCASALSLTKIADLPYVRSIVCGDGSPPPPLGPGPVEPLNPARLIGQWARAPIVRSVVSRRQPPRRSGPGPIDGRPATNRSSIEGAPHRPSADRQAPRADTTQTGRTCERPVTGRACSSLATESAALVTFTSARPPRKSGGPPGLSATAALPDPREIASIAHIAIEANSPPCSQRMVRICRGGRV
jgi:hypothetical protein